MRIQQTNCNHRYSDITRYDDVEQGKPPTGTKGASYWVWEVVELVLVAYPIVHVAYKTGFMHQYNDYIYEK